MGTANRAPAMGTANRVWDSGKLCEHFLSISTGRANASESCAHTAVLRVLSLLHL